MTTPNVPLRMEHTVEVPGTPEQVWAAIATANGISSWFTETELEERAGGAVVFHMGEDGSSRGSVTGWEPPGRFEYAEPEWAEMTGHAGADVTPIVTEFLVEAQAGGTCVVRIVSSAFGSGADWEQEFFDDMTKHWTPFFDNLRLYLTYFPGQQVTPMSVQAEFPGPHAAVWAALVDAIGAPEVGQTVEIHGVAAQVERITSDGGQILVRLNDPVPGFLLFSAFEPGNGLVHCGITGYLFSDGAPAYVEHEQPRWKAWLESLVIPVA